MSKASTWPRSNKSSTARPWQPMRSSSATARRLPWLPPMVSVTSSRLAPKAASSSTTSTSCCRHHSLSARIVTRSLSDSMPGAKCSIPFDEAAAQQVIETIAAEGYEAVAVGFIHSYTNGAHERRFRDMLLPDCPTSPCQSAPRSRRRCASSSASTPSAQMRTYSR